ncbi:MAG: sugar transferase [Deltaproteobacteria bacterium]|nr:sugar transferase [Deltaproteobacteria bacterium]
MLKRLFDILFSAAILIVLSPVLHIILFLVWYQDRESPFYIAPRVGKDGKPFKMIKVRSMIVGADKTGVDSTAGDDKRITAIGKFVRTWKVDEIMQLWNVVAGDMSLVGPRPNVPREVALYTEEEKKLLSVQPGMTDFSSIVFSDEGDILHGKPDPDLAYHQLIRPGKSRLGLLYIKCQSLWIDLAIIVLTVVALIDRYSALRGVEFLLKNPRVAADAELIEIAARRKELQPLPPPGATEIVQSRA